MKHTRRTQHQRLHRLLRCRVRQSHWFEQAAGAWRALHRSFLKG